MVPGKNDDMDQVAAMCKWIKNELGPDVPLHFSRFYPLYKLKSLPPTPVSTLERARNRALQEGLHFVYIGNVPGHPGEHTDCPKCCTRRPWDLGCSDENLTLTVQICNVRVNLSLSEC